MKRNERGREGEGKRGKRNGKRKGREGKGKVKEN